MNSKIAAVVLCAGKGTRMKSDRAKVLHAILNRPLCAYPAKAWWRGGDKADAASFVCSTSRPAQAR